MEQLKLLAIVFGKPEMDRQTLLCESSLCSMGDKMQQALQKSVSGKTYLWGEMAAEDGVTHPF